MGNGKKFFVEVSDEDLKKDLKNYAFKSVIEINLFAELFFVSRKYGKISDFAHDLDGIDCTTQTKFNFLNQLADYGVLRPYSKEMWGGKEMIEYKINKDKLYDLFITTELGGRARRIFKEYAGLWDEVFG